MQREVIVINIAKIRCEDIANGPGIRVSIYVQGCTRQCEDCFNKETWDFNGGSPFTNNLKERFLELGNKKKIVGYSILGGEPLQQGKEMLSLVQDIRKAYPEKTIWMWTGYKYEDLSDEQLEIVKEIDVLVDGEFVTKLKSSNRHFIGSHNQRIIDIQKTILKGSVELFSL